MLFFFYSSLYVSSGINSFCLQNSFEECLWVVNSFFFYFKNVLILPLFCIENQQQYFISKVPCEPLLISTWLSLFECYLFGPIWPCMTGSFVPHLAIWLHWNGNFSIFSSFPSSLSLLHWFALSHMEGLPPALLEFLVLLFLLPLTHFTFSFLAVLLGPLGQPWQFLGEALHSLLDYYPSSLLDMMHLATPDKSLSKLDLDPGSSDFNTVFMSITLVGWFRKFRCWWWCIS